MLIQFGFNIWRLVFVCFSLPMYNYWHEGFGKYIFSAVATFTAVCVIQLWLVRADHSGHSAFSSNLFPQPATPGQQPAVNEE
jgi:hypothetical protein